MEIGSEFWGVPLCEKQNNLLDGNLLHTLSGRTALELIAQDLKAERGAKSIYMPAYCCDSMLEPFKKQGYEIKLYAVEPYSKTVHRQVFTDHGCDAILLLDYFGFESEETTVFAMMEKLRGTSVIIDRVQSAFSETKALEYADYTVTSWRKWFFSNAATAEKKCGEWLVHETEKNNEEYISLRRNAARLKADYIENGVGEKPKFLVKFGEAEEILDNDFSDYAAEEKSLEEIRYADVDFIVSQRRENAALIYDELKKLPAETIRPLYAQMGENDVPLFVPVLVKPEIRAELRQHLIKNEVYCPIHWPSGLGGANKLYDGELSLICDQRYGTEDIKRQMTLISEFINGYLL